MADKQLEFAHTDDRVRFGIETDDILLPGKIVTIGISDDDQFTATALSSAEAMQLRDWLLAHYPK